MPLAMGNRKGLVDVLSFYGVINEAYSRHTPEKSHLILEEHIMRFGSKENLVLYIDGGPSLEKKETGRIRSEARAKAAVKCSDNIGQLEDTIKYNRKPRKRHFSDINASLGLAFYWSTQDRQSFISYMQQAGWTLRICETEADVAIAVDCLSDDVVISGDSDLLGYDSVSTVWRPISRYLVLEYKLTEVCRQLELTRGQLTTVAVVSANDYNRNIYSLGPATNYSIVKGLSGQVSFFQKFFKRDIDLLIHWRRMKRRMVTMVTLIWVGQA